MAKRLGKTRIIAETGAGQHGVATATVCALMELSVWFIWVKLILHVKHLMWPE